MPSPREQFECPHCGNGVWLFEEAPADTECPHCGKRLLQLTVLSPTRETLWRQLENAPRVSLLEFVPDSELLRLVPSSLVREAIVFPISRTERSLKLAVTDSIDLETCDKFRFVLNCELEFVIAEEAEIRAAIARFYPN